MVAVRTQPGLVDGLESLAFALEDLRLSDTSPTDGSAQERRDRVVRTIRAYLIPNLTSPDAPLCVVLVGPTGAGKSTLVNSLSGLHISETGPIRPTTKDPVVLCAEADRRRFEQIGGVHCEVVTGNAPILSRMALVDTPDIDSTETSHRMMTERLIDSADLVVFVTSALRYADQVPWEVLRRAVSRGAGVIHVLNRLTTGSAGAVVDFRARLEEASVEGDVVRVPEHHMGPGSHTVPALAVRDLRRRLVDLAGEHDRHRRDTFNRVLNSVIDQATELADLADVDEARSDEVDDGIRVAFEGRVGRLDLSGLASMVELAHPPRAMWRRRRWARANHLEDDEVVRMQRVIGDRLVATVESDLRAGVLSLKLPGLDPAEVTTGLRPLIVSSVEGWIDRVRRLADLADGRHRGLAIAVLSSATFGPQNGEAAKALYGVDVDLVIERARLLLHARLGVVYDQAGLSVVQRRHRTAADAGGDGLRDRLREVIVRSHFTDA